ncbi:hypothetical protein DLR11_09300 [Salmonella enterica subsp. salamae]|uniref:PIG-L family deacetylase n=3 Tax=Salmonella enterica TaxID=28901 RepID=A0A379QSR6_SALER|nr:hypothetical protein [Salmonella enterica]ECC1655749.1 hypothetical protein [Salmonella enterica subsp. salamae]HCM1999613.1 hypothetical protein [Salmonella enterica subsp. salamae serovar [1],40:z35:e,n,x,z15]ASG90170.1 hypothetical protein LFZ47_22960 [Salmonella enterica subsp. salamae serovar 55:k:z39 str. 1315K]ECC1693172.1 hypothetical protein [Salmonella enterica subsp. salamae]ECD9414127.1 hypothetical protein [Salmonella enterica subsp. salamae]
MNTVKADSFPMVAGDNLILFVPHHDDTILGCGHFIIEAQARGVLTTVTRSFVCCSRTNFFANYQEGLLSEEQIQQVTQARIEEDTFGSNDLFNGSYNWMQGIMGEWDAPIRGYSGPVTAGGGSWGNFSTFRQQEIDMYNRLISQCMWMLAQENTTILCLIANGSHVDHFNVREAMLHAAYLMGDNAKAQLVFTEDEPYTSDNPDDRDTEYNKLNARAGGKVAMYQLDCRYGESGKTLMHEIFNAHYRTQWTQDYEDDLLKNVNFRYYVLDKAAYKTLTKDNSCTESYCTLAG